MAKKQEALQKYIESALKRTDKIPGLEEEIRQSEKTVQLKLEKYNQVKKRLEDDLGRFDANKIQDFKDSVKDFLRSFYETQKKIVGAWQTYSQEAPFERVESGEVHVDAGQTMATEASTAVNKD